MRNIILLLSCLLTFNYFLVSQTQFENPGFEQWDEVGTPYEEPTEWSSIKTSDHTASSASPKVIGISDDAHSGNHSLYLINKYVGLIDYVATGNLTNGRIHVSPDLDPYKSTSFTDTSNSQWNTPLVHRPDSVVGWYKANPVPGDFPTVKVILHADSNSIPGDSLKWIARAVWNGQSGVKVDNWTRFSAPFDYYLDDTPEYLLSVITSGNGYYAIEDSEAWFDDLELIYNGTSVDEFDESNVTVSYINGSLNIRFSSSHTVNMGITVIEMNGKTIYQDEINGNGVFSLPVQLRAGIYLVKLSNGQKILTSKIVSR